MKRRDGPEMNIDFVADTVLYALGSLPFVLAA